MGGELVFKMGPRPNRSWASLPNDYPVSEINAEPIAPTPVINAAGKTFKTRLEISLSSVAWGQEIRYTTDGTEPNRNSPLFAGPFFIDRTTQVKALAIDSRGEKSLVATATFHQIPRNWNLKLFSKYSQQYSAGGDLTLIDASGAARTSLTARGRAIRVRTWRGISGPVETLGSLSMRS